MRLGRPDSPVCAPHSHTDFFHPSHRLEHKRGYGGLFALHILCGPVLELKVPIAAGTRDSSSLYILAYYRVLSVYKYW